jgi:predicted 3-demethylubiquinone-9 3-methyltransferase (glyoxalase superfamily)
VKIRTFLWFGEGLTEALAFYAETFGDLFALHGTFDGEGEFTTAEFSIAGHEFVGMNSPGGPTFNDSISISVETDGQEETDRIWNAISTSGVESRCGWCRDKWGIAWQVIPKQMHEFVQHPDSDIAGYAWNALMQMNRIVIADLSKPSA